MHVCMCGVRDHRVCKARDRVCSFGLCVCELGEDKEGKEQQLLQSKNEKVREAGRDNK